MLMDVNLCLQHQLSRGAIDINAMVTSGSVDGTTELDVLNVAGTLGISFR